MIEKTWTKIYEIDFDKYIKLFMILKKSHFMDEYIRTYSVFVSMHASARNSFYYHVLYTFMISVFICLYVSL